MYKVLIVDDELLVRNYIRKLIEGDEATFKVCAEAINGVDALNKIALYAPDIMIMDIHMPIMDGVTLSKEVSKSYPEIKVLALSSYNDYQYVRETLKTGVVDYILKDAIDETELLRLLNDIKKQIDQGKARQELITQENNTMNQIKEIAREQYMRDLYLGVKRYTDEIGESIILPLENIKEDYMLLIWQIEHYFIKMQAKSEEDKTNYIDAIKKFCLQCIDQELYLSTVFLDEGRIVTLLPCEGIKSEAILLDKANKVSQKVAYTLDKYLNLKIKWGVSHKQTRFAELNKAYQEAVGMLGTHKDITNGDTIEPLSLNDEKQFLIAIETKSLNHIEKILNSILNNNNLYLKNSILLQIRTNEILAIASKFAAEYQLDIDCIYVKNSELISRCIINKDTAQLKQILMNIFRDLFSAGGYRDENEALSNPIKKAIDYIHLNYYKDISLVDVAEAVQLNATYFSRLFKKELEIGFVDYLNQIRIDNAEKRIKSGEKNLTKIAEDVGFKTYSYFSKSFKEVKGASPKRYSHDLF